LSAAQDHIVPLLDDGGQCPPYGPEANRNDTFLAAPMVMVPDGPDVASVQAARKAANGDQIVVVRLLASPEVATRARDLARNGTEVIHLVFDQHGKERAPSNPRHMRDVLRDVHGVLVKDGSRDQITVIASGGIALAEHMTKAILCGADLVAIDIPLLIALECRLCGECKDGNACPISLAEIDQEFAATRVVNLMGAWHLQLVEMLGAMGIREVRRLRGETGRCMFFEDLERETFGHLFGKRKEPQHGI
jgi:hypothetical protein